MRVQSRPLRARQMISARFRSEDYFLKDFLTVRRSRNPSGNACKISGQDLWARSLGKISGQDLWARSLGKISGIECGRTQLRLSRLREDAKESSFQLRAVSKRSRDRDGKRRGGLCPGEDIKARSRVSLWRESHAAFVRALARLLVPGAGLSGLLR